jgi:hypothetical protein
MPPFAHLVELREHESLLHLCLPSRRLGNRGFHFASLALGRCLGVLLLQPLRRARMGHEQRARSLRGFTHHGIKISRQLLVGGQRGLLGRCER